MHDQCEGDMIPLALSCVGRPLKKGGNETKTFSFLVTCELENNANALISISIAQRNKN
jgi:hypothetical protein